MLDMVLAVPVVRLKQLVTSVTFFIRFFFLLHSHCLSSLNGQGTVTPMTMTTEIWLMIHFDGHIISKIWL